MSQQSISLLLKCGDTASARMLVSPCCHFHLSLLDAGAKSIHPSTSDTELTSGLGAAGVYVGGSLGDTSVGDVGEEIEERHVEAARQGAPGFCVTEKYRVADIIRTGNEKNVKVVTSASKSKHT